MLNRFLQNILLIAIILFSFACQTNKSSVATESCQTVATVKDFTGLDGCGLLILLENGDKLLPAKVNDKNFTLRDGQKIRFDYKELENMASVCMAEKAAIEITCIELLDGKPVIPECFNTEDPTTVSWMREVIFTTVLVNGSFKKI